jgi:hypothetical protein
MRIGFLAVLLTLTLGAQAEAAPRFIKSPSSNVVCQLQKKLVLCTVYSLAKHADLRRTGKARIYDQNSNPPSEGVPTLAYGKSTREGRFRCTSKTTGMKCVRRSGVGFLAAREGIKRVERR